MWIILAACVALASASCDDAPSEVTWSTEYTIEGVLDLPYNQIREPFTAYFSTKLGSSRIDYFNGTVKTYQLSNDGDYGTTYEVVPVTTQTETNEMTCFETAGSSDSVTSTQPILPEMTGFTCNGTEVMDGYEVQRWTYEVADEKKVNNYIVLLRWENSIAIPVMYEMRGYDSLIGSHYDHYYLFYHSFSPKISSSDVFNVDKNSACESSSGNLARMNPMKEYIHSYSQHIEKDFDSFKQTHGKNYETEHEHAKRFHIFRHNYRYIHSKNRAHLGYKLAINHLADRTDDELAALRGRRVSKRVTYNGGQPFPYSEDKLKKIRLPKDHDWRLYGAVTPVKDQGTCGSCWSFGSAGTVEGAYFLKTGTLVRLSSQALMDCSWGYGNNGCDGGIDYQSYEWIMNQGGLPNEYAYGGYLGQDGYCHASEVELYAPVKGWVNVTTDNDKALRTAIFKHGPISVSIFAALKTFSFYSSGVFYDKDCKNGYDELDHSVLAVGYGVMHGKKYWLIKNSWSNYWGDQGYILIAAKNNNCGVMTAPTYVVL